MTPLIDSDILLHEIGWSSQFKDKDSGEEVILEPDRAFDLLDKKITLICGEVGATQPPILFITDSEWLANKDKRTFVTNFRYGVATTKPYKGTRHNPKPFHFYNLLIYMLTNYKCIVSEGGYEADDFMCMYQHSHEDTIICSRDKDLRMCPGWHYSWECGGQASIGPHLTDDIGCLFKASNGKTLGYGKALFYYQMLVGDTADNIPGLSGCGDAKALKMLDGATTEYEYYMVVKNAYKEQLGPKSKEYFEEQANLLWMVREKEVKYEHPKNTTNMDRKTLF